MENTSTTDGTTQGYKLKSTQTELPPLHPPLLTAVGHWIYRTWKRPGSAQSSMSTSSSSRATTLPVPASHSKGSQSHTLTVFFGASWGGNLLILCYVMAILLVTITLGRSLGLWYVWSSARLFGLHVIETESARQIIGCLRILCSMKEVLVTFNGSWWFEGHRLDERLRWDDWRLRYEKGEFDEDYNATPPNSPGSGILDAPVRQKTNQSIVSVAHVPQISPMSPMRVSSSHVSSQAQQPQMSTIGLARSTNARRPPAVSRTQCSTGP